jgi:hypothetical protein
MDEHNEAREAHTAPKRMDWSLVLGGGFIGLTIATVVGTTALGPAHGEARTLLASGGLALTGLLMALAGYASVKRWSGIRLLLSIWPQSKLTGMGLLLYGLTQSVCGAVDLFFAPLLSEWLLIDVGVVAGGFVMLVIVWAVLPRDVWR